MLLRTAVLAAAALAFWPGTPAHAAAAPIAWCGGDLSQTDRRPDAVSSRQVGVVYAFPAGGEDRFSALASAIVTDIGAIDAWWRREDATRAPRFDLFAFPSCPSRIGLLDLARVQLPRGAEAYAPLEGRFTRIANDLFGAPFGFASRHKKYLVYYDASVAEPNVCGTGGGEPTEGPSFAIVYVRACGAQIGVGGFAAHVAVHELVHALGAVPDGAPNVCVQSRGHVCDGAQDLMFPTTSGDPLDASILDVGRNDYYGHSGSWFDVQDSPWLSHLDAALVGLSVTVAGGGSGRVASDLPGIECPPACAIDWEQGTEVVLTATPGAGTRFAGWSGACTGEAPCRVSMDATRAVSARFVLRVPLTVRVVGRSGSGTVVASPGELECSATCTNEFDAGEVVSLTARPTPGSRFTGWSGACTGLGVCRIAVQTATTVTAAFASANVRVSVRVSGNGRVTSAPRGLSCTRGCGAPFRFGATVRLRAAPAPGWRFASWGGACRGAGACVLRATADRSVRATFRRAGS